MAQYSLEDFVIMNEGSNMQGGRHAPYHCPAGHLTIGYGRNLDARGISEREAKFLLRNDLDVAVRDASSLVRKEGVDWDALSAGRQMALTDLAFNIGRFRMSGFHKMLAAIAAGDWNKAADELLDSKYARDVGRRAERNAALLRGES